MKNDHYLAAWIVGELSDEKLESLEGKAALADFIKIKAGAAQLSLPVSQRLDWATFSKKLPPKKEAKIIKFNWVYAVAASLTVLLGLSSFFLSQKQYPSSNGFTQIELPDGSRAKLTPGATLQHQRLYGFVNRKIEMSGEITYEVKKGKPFVVHSNNGVVEVLGTTFKVLDTADFFEVICTEGKVKVTHGESTHILTPGLSYNSIDKAVAPIATRRYDTPSALYYNRVPLDYVIRLVETYYGLKINFQASQKYYFTGLLPLDDEQSALKSIQLPFSFQLKKQADGTMLLIE